MTLELRTPIGMIAIADILVEYDGPRVFVGETTSGQRLLGCWIGEEPDNNEWILTPISRTRLAVVKTGQMSLREALEQAEDGWVYWIRTSSEPGKSVCQLTQVDRINPDWLPDQDAYLNLPGERLPKSEPDPIVEAVRANREVLNLYLHGGRTRLHELEASYLGRILIRVQSLMLTLVAGDVSSRGPFPQRAINQNSLVVSGTMAGSFGVRLESMNMRSLFPDNPTTSAFSALIDLLDASNDRDNLRRTLTDVRPRAVNQLHMLFSTLSDGNLGLKADWGSPHGLAKSATIPLGSVRQALLVLDEEGELSKEQYEIHGRIVGINVEKKRFEFVGDNGERYRGAYDPEFVEESGIALNVDRGVSGTTILEELLEMTVYGEEKPSFTMLKFTPDTTLSII